MSLTTVHEPAELAVVVGGHAHRRLLLGGVLASAGFMAHTAAGLGGTTPAGAGGLVILLCDGAPRDIVAAIREAVTARPEALVLPVLPPTSSNALMRRALLAGASGILFDPDAERALVPTCHALLAGQLSVPSVLSRQLAPRHLSHREKQILALVVRGATNREIARALFLAESTIKTHLSSAFRKIDARSRAEAVALIREPDSAYGREILAMADEPVEPTALSVS